MKKYGNETVRVKKGHIIEIAPLEYIRELRYDEAILYCTFLDINGTKGWRMPTYEEALCIYLDEVGHKLPPSEKYNNDDGVTENTKRPYDIYGSSNRNDFDRNHYDLDVIERLEQPQFWTTTIDPNGWCEDDDCYFTLPLLVKSKVYKKRWGDNDALYTECIGNYVQPVRTTTKSNRYSNKIRRQREITLINERWKALAKSNRLAWEHKNNNLKHKVTVLENYIIKQEGKMPLRLFVDCMPPDNFDIL